MGVRRGRLPPAGGDEVGERPLLRLDPVLRFAVLEHIDIAVSAVHEQEPAGRVILLMPTVEQQRVDAVAAESDVDEPGTARVGRAHHQRHVVQRGAGVAVAPIYPRGDAADLGTHGL